MELLNKQLDDELEKVKGEHTSLHRSSVELHDSFRNLQKKGTRYKNAENLKIDSSRELHNVIQCYKGHLISRRNQ